MDPKPLIKNFIHYHFTGTIATADLKGEPHAATIDFAICDDLSLLFNTDVASKKYKNLSENLQICAVFSDSNHITVKYYGVARELAGEEAIEWQDKYDKSVVKRSWKIGDYRLFKVTPTYIRYSNYTNIPPKEYEISF